MKSLSGLWAGKVVGGGFRVGFLEEGAAPPEDLTSMMVDRRETNNTEGE